MSYSKPMWMQVTSCRYKNSPSFGAVNDCKLESRTGSSVSNSHVLATIDWSKKIYDEVICFNMYLDDKLVKQNIHYRNGDRAGDLIKTKRNRFVNSDNISTFKFKNK